MRIRGKLDTPRNANPEPAAAAAAEPARLEAALIAPVPQDARITPREHQATTVAELLDGIALLVQWIDQ